MSDDTGVIIEWSAAAIQVGNRHRRDHGEMNPLIASIERHGLLQPITITPEGFLICGARRLAAVKSLGWKTVRVWVRSGLSDRLGQLLAEQDENVLHKPLTPLEAAGLYRELKALLEEDAKRRQEPSRFSSEHQPGRDGEGKLPTPSLGTTGRARAQAAAMVPGGVSYKTFDKIGYLQKIAADEAMPTSCAAARKPSWNGSRAAMLSRPATSVYATRLTRNPAAHSQSCTASPKKPSPGSRLSSGRSERSSANHPSSGAVTGRSRHGHSCSPGPN